MGCFWIGINHTSHGLVKVSPARRLLLELISGVLLVISWCVIVPGVIHVGTLYVDNIQEMADEIQVKGSTLYEDKLKRSAYGLGGYRVEDGGYGGYVVGGSYDNVYVPEQTESVIAELYAVVPFMLVNSVYLIVTIFFAILNLIYRKDILLKKTMVGRFRNRDMGEALPDQHPAVENQDSELDARAAKQAMAINKYGNIYEGPITLQQHENEVETITTYSLLTKTDLATSRPVPPSATVTTASFQQEVLDTIQKLEEARDSMALAGIRHPDLTDQFVTRANEMVDFLVDAYNVADVLAEDTAMGGKFSATLSVLIGSL